MVIKYKIPLSWSIQHEKRKYCFFDMHNIMHKECNLLHGYIDTCTCMTGCMTSKKEHALS